MDDYLCQSIKQAIEYPEASQERNNATEALVLLIDQLPEVKDYLDKGLLPYYTEALKQTEKDIKKNIANFPSRYKFNLAGINCQQNSEAKLVRKYFIKWVMLILKADCIDEWRKQKKRTRDISTSKRLGEERESTTVEETIPDPTISGIEYLLQVELQGIGKQLREYIENDPNGKLKNCHPRGNNQCNCQTLAKMRFLKQPPATLNEIAEQLKTPLQTVNSRLQRQCLPLLQEISQELGYE